MSSQLLNFNQIAREKVITDALWLTPKNLCSNASQEPKLENDKTHEEDDDHSSNTNSRKPNVVDNVDSGVSSSEPNKLASEHPKLKQEDSFYDDLPLVSASVDKSNNKSDKMGYSSDVVSSSKDKEDSKDSSKLALINVDLEK